MSSTDEDNLPLVRFVKMESSKKQRKKTNKKKVEPNLQAAIKQSRVEKNTRNEEEKKHEKSADHMIFANGAYRLKVPKDGDCFFASISSQLDQKIETRDLRNITCNHLLKFKSSYHSFLSGKDPKFEKSVKKIRKLGTWSGTLADALPLAMANLVQKQIIIFTSIKSTLAISPNLSIEPELQTERRNLMLAHLRIPQREHYDAVFLLTGKYILLNICFLSFILIINNNELLLIIQTRLHPFSK